LVCKDSIIEKSKIMWFNDIRITVSLYNGIYNEVILLSMQIFSLWQGYIVLLFAQ